MTLACEGANSKLVTVAYEKSVDNSLVQILKLKFGQYFAAVNLVEIMKLNLGRDSEARKWMDGWTDGWIVERMNL